MAESNDRSTLTRAMERILPGHHLCMIYENLDQDFAAMECGADAFLTKPFTLKELKALVRRLIKSATPP